MIRLYVADLQYKPWSFCSINQFCTHISKPGYPLQFWSPDLTLCLTKASIKIMISLKIITIHVIIIISCASMKLQVKFQQNIITCLSFWHETGGKGGTHSRGVLIRRRVLNQIITTCKRFCHHCLMKVTSVFHLQLEEDSHNQTDSLWQWWGT